MLSLTTFCALFILCHSQSEDELVFLVIGDWGDAFYWDEDSPQMQVAEAMNSWAEDNSPKFIITTGDNFYDDGVRSADDAWFEQKWKRVYSGENIRDLQWRISVGNHDYDPDEDRPGDNDGGNEMFQIARTAIDPLWYFPSLWYKFTEATPAGDVDFFMVDTQAIDAEMNYFEDEYTWLEQELSQSNASLKLVFGHHPIYTVGDDAPGTISLQARFEPLLVQYGVTAFFAGHDHNMSHLWWTNGTKPEQIIIGSGGRALNPENEYWSEHYRNNLGMNSTYFEEFGFGAVFIDADRMRVDMIDVNGSVLNEITFPLGSNN